MDYGVILDLETTGLDATQDEIIEIGLILFAVDGKAEPTILNMYGSLQEPVGEIKPEITALTGIETQHCAGQQIDWKLVREYLEKSSVVIAHNATFDAGFLKRCEAVAGMDLHWACSRQHIDWKSKGFGSEKLVYLAADHGFVNPFAHRALFDCASTFRLVCPYFQELMDNSYKISYEVAAVGAPFASKDCLKERGYRWDGGARVWRRNIGAQRLEEERRFLADSVYGGGPDTHEENELAPIW